MQTSLVFFFLFFGCWDNVDPAAAPRAGRVSLHRCREHACTCACPPARAVHLNMGAASFEHEHTAALAATRRLCATAIRAVNPHALASLTRLRSLVCYADARQLRSAAGQVAALSLTHLDLIPGTGLGDADALALSGFSSLQRLALEGNQPVPEGAAALAQLSSLTSLRLCKNAAQELHL